MCEACGDFNYAKREQTADLTGHYALVTGARVKIGYQASLKLLRAGAHVDRHDALSGRRRGPILEGAGFRRRSASACRSSGSICGTRRASSCSRASSCERLPRLDYILNNACQTVRRPGGILSATCSRRGRAARRACRGVARRCSRVTTSCCRTLSAPQRARARALVAVARRGQGEGLVHSAALSQRRYLDEDYRDGDTLFPADRYDEDRQQVDLREINSWRLRLHEVETPELLEVQLVNAIAPYILNARLKPLMVRTAGRHKHIVNVSAMEGQFYRTTKTDKHPHTNMAKAALNMMTRTSAPDFVKDGIHMNAVDTGWVTDEDPAVHAARKAELGFSPPLDIIDGAARIVDPIFVGRLTGDARVGPVPEGLQAGAVVAVRS